jgi:threonine dehydrogenase-like Zn-dependent dehydrogenase
MSLMKAVRYYGQKDLRVDEIPIPELKDDQVKVSSTQVGFILVNLIESIIG